MVGYTQEIWFARTTKAFSQQSAGDNDEENDAEDNDDDDGTRMESKKVMNLITDPL